MKKTVLHAVVIIVLIGQLFPNQKVFANPVSIPTTPSQLLDMLRDDTTVVVGESNETGKVTFIGSKDGTPLSTGNRSFIPFVGGNDVNSAALQEYAPLFGINDFNSELTLQSSLQADTDRTTSRYQQVYRGIPVIAGEITLNTSSSGGLYAMMGEASPDLSLDTTPQIDAAEAAQQATQLMTSRYGAAASDVILTSPALWIYDPCLLEPSSMPAELVWRFEATSVSNHSLDVLILVNALHGGISLQFNQIDTSFNHGIQQSNELAQEGPTTEVPVTETVDPPAETPTVTATETATETPTETPVVTETPIATDTPTVTPTATATETLMALPATLPNAINGVTIAVYNMNHLTEDDGATLPGTFVCNDTTPNCTSGVDTDADHALSYAIDTYNFFYNQHGRNSLNNAGLNINLSVHYDNNYANAFWNGTQAVFGDNFTPDDIVGHELTHGVTQYTSNLYYYYQSGAINESFSDIWGEFVDQTNGKGTDTPAVKWLMGEDYGAFRSMSNPPLYGDPDKMTSSWYQFGDLGDLDYYDNGGVHTNSGINNKAAYLMTDGDTFNGYSITGLGITKVAAIYYEVQTHLLTSGSNYNDLYYALHQACVNINGGSAGVTLQDCAEVQKALDAVEMNEDPLGTFMPQAEICPANTQPSNLFFDDFETSNAKWNLSDYSTGSSVWGRVLGYSASGSYSLYAPNYSGTADTRASFANSVAVPSSGTTYLYFNHAFGFEYGASMDGINRTWDGAVLEYRIDSGAWQDASTLYDSGQNYNGSVYAPVGGTNPLAGQTAFVRDSHGYISSRFNLSTTAIKGHNVNFRWRIGTDASVGDLGWLLDDVSIYQCQSDITGSLIFADGFSTSYVYADSTSGNVTRDAANSLLNFTSSQATPLHYSIPIHATNAPIELNFRFKISSTSGSSMLWVGLAHELTEITPAVAAADLAGTFIGIDSNDKIQFLNLYPNGSFSQVDGTASTLAYGGTQVWRNATLIVNGLNWSISVKDDNGSVIGTLSGTLPTQQDHYDYLTLMYDNGGGTDSITGQIDDLYVYGTEQTATFNDVPYNYTETLGGVSYLLHDYVQALYDNGLTAGTSSDPPLYSPTTNLDRSMAAVFILRANYGTSYTPPVEPWTTFTNESWANNAYAQKWAEGLYQAHLTAGCQASPLMYCPDNILLREEAVVFALRMKYDYFDGEGNLVSYTPPAASGTVFGDMTDTGYWATKWAEKAYLDGILPSCGTMGGKPMFCQYNSVDRAWAAYMIVQAKNLALP
ncbi:MAG TPA: hypothetical protein DIW44_12960 [Anaerolineaceae bacterium]|nr:hypothetical protein [Anaerolineaceae bacterium]